MTDDTATDYLVEQSTKTLGSIIEQLEVLRNEFSEVNLEIIANRSPDQVPVFHEMLSKLHTNLATTRLVSIIMAAASKG